MKKYSGIPELLEQYMMENGTDERWVTVQELRERFCLNRYQYNTISGFLLRLEFGTFGQCPYIVLRIEKVGRTSLSDPPKCRYLVKKKYTLSAAVRGVMHHTDMQARRKAGSGESG
jgi:hypothetical protein